MPYATKRGLFLMRLCRYSQTCAPTEVAVELIAANNFSLDDALFIWQTLVEQMILQVKRLLDESTILRFRRCMEGHQLDGRSLSTFNALLSVACASKRAWWVTPLLLLRPPLPRARTNRDPAMYFSTKDNQCQTDGARRPTSAPTAISRWCTFSEPPAMSDTSPRASRCSVDF